MRRECCLQSSRWGVTRKENTSSYRKGKGRLEVWAANSPLVTVAALSTPCQNLSWCRGCQVSPLDHSEPQWLHPSAKQPATHTMCAAHQQGPVPQCLHLPHGKRKPKVYLHIFPSLKYHFLPAFDSTAKHEAPGRSAKQQIHLWSLQMPHYKHRSVLACSNWITGCIAAGFHTHPYMFSGGAIHRASF